MRILEDGTIELSRTADEEIGLKHLQSAVGGYVECVCCGDALPTGRTLDIWINEDGKLKGMPYNLTATMLAAEFGAIGPDDYIAGPAYIASVGNNGETLPLTRWEQLFIAELLRGAQSA